MSPDPRTEPCGTCGREIDECICNMHPALDDDWDPLEELTGYDADWDEYDEGELYDDGNSESPYSLG
jgi:hypothetical protein